MSEQALQQKLADGLRQLNLPQAVEPPQQQRLLDYIALLYKWNKAYNLTAVREPLQMVTRHLLDSLAIAPFVEGQRLIDVGTGAGLPGIPLALLFADKHFTLLDTNSKKTRFVIQAVAELELANVDVVQSRVEIYQPGQPYNAVITRAYASLADMVAQTGHLLDKNGVFLAMKGTCPQSELAGLPAGFAITTHKITVPGLEEQRHLLQIKQTES